MRYCVAPGGPRQTRPWVGDLRRAEQSMRQDIGTLSVAFAFRSFVSRTEPQSLEVTKDSSGLMPNETLYERYTLVLKLRSWTIIGHCNNWIPTVKALCGGMAETSQRLAQADFRGNLQDGVPGTTATGPKKGKGVCDDGAHLPPSGVEGRGQRVSPLGHSGGSAVQCRGQSGRRREDSGRGGVQPARCVSRRAVVTATGIVGQDFIRGILPLIAKQPHPQLTPWMPAKGE
ncbi:hypothetical protein J6590_083362 [Homalodisca vitripennis]|nr:hypothetical protein J6590_083362 [Homalodisca vitripennis]